MQIAHYLLVYVLFFFNNLTSPLTFGISGASVESILWSILSFPYRHRGIAFWTINRHSNAPWENGFIPILNHRVTLRHFDVKQKYGRAVQDSSVEHLHGGDFPVIVETLLVSFVNLH
jgi:hypothetical protein